MKFSGVTKDVQARYSLSNSFLTSSCEYEEWDTPEKLCHLLFETTPLIGEVQLSAEQYRDFSERGRELFAKLMKGGEQSLSRLEKQILSAAVVFHVQRTDDDKDGEDETDDQLWSSVLKSLGFDEVAYGCKEQKAYHKLRDLLWKNLHVSTEHGKKYYNTLKMQALAPATSICELYNIVYRFYKKNLECQYDEAENAFKILAQNVQRKISKEHGTDKIDLGSSVWALKSSLKILFQYQPEYMAAVCDAITEKMDLYLRGDNPCFCDCNRWDVQLKKWFQSKTKEERDSMRQIRAKRIRQKIITKKDAICPQYLLHGEELIIYLPNIRLPEITQPPIARLYQRGRVVVESRMSVYGDSMCYTTQEFSFELSRIKEICFDDDFDFRVEIDCGGNILYDSQTLLYRQYIVFNENGYESTPAKCQSGKAWIIAAANAEVKINDPEDEYYDESVDFQRFQISLLSAQEILINDVDILLQQDQKDIALRNYCIPEAVKGASVVFDGKNFRIYQKPPKLRIILGNNESAKSYQLFLDSSQHSLYEYIGESRGTEIDLPGAARFCHCVRIVEFQTGEVVFEADYIILPQFSFKFSDSYYLNKDCHGEVTIRFSGGSRTHAFELSENQTVVQFPLLGNGIDVSVDVPKVEITANGENILYWPGQKWYRDISQDTFIKVSTPQNVRVDFVLGSKFIPKTRRGTSFELGNFIYANEWKTSPCTLGALIQSDNNTLDQKITDFYFEPVFLASPLVRSETCITWQPDSLFIGPDAPAFIVELENDNQSDPWTYRSLHAGKPFEKNFSCKPGIYGCQVFLDLPNDNPFVKDDKRQLVWEEQFEIEDTPENRFIGKCVRLTKVWFWSYETKNVEIADIHYNDAVIFDIDYIGLSDFSGDLENSVPAYEGILGFRSPDGKWNYMNKNPESELYENVNPVSFCITNGNLMKVYNADGEPLQLDAKVFMEKRRVRIKNRKENYTAEEARKWFPIADEFAFREEDDS